MATRWLRAAGGALFACALLGFAYAAMTAVLHPENMPTHVVHFLPLRLDTFGAGCFALSFATQCALGLSAVRPPTKIEAE
jgi:hypothetical protein